MTNITTMNENATVVPTKSRAEVLRDLPVNDFIIIAPETLDAWKNLISTAHGLTDKKFGIKVVGNDIQLRRYM